MSYFCNFFTRQEDDHHPFSQNDGVISELTDWLQQQIPQLENLDFTLPKEPLMLDVQSGDAGARCYFALPQFPSLLAVFAPTDSENTQQFIAIANYLREQGIHTPQIYAVDLERGFLLVEHMGSQLYLSELSNDNVNILYSEAMLTLLNMQQIPRDIDCLESYSSENLLAEMALFPKWFVSGLLEKTHSNDEQVMLDDVFTKLVDSALEQPQCFMHHDFHSRNLIRRKMGKPGVIDFQDGVWGPFTYDLVSLLRDCYVCWPTEWVNHWMITYANMAVDSGIIEPVSSEKLQRWFDWMGLQRHIQVLGTFARLHLRDHKSWYLTNLSLVIHYILEVTERYPEFVDFHQWFCDVLMPQIEKETWYTDYHSVGYSPV